MGFFFAKEAMKVVFSYFVGWVLVLIPIYGIYMIQLPLTFIWKWYLYWQYILETQYWYWYDTDTRTRFPLGVLAHGCAHARPSAQPPIDVSGIFLVHMSAELPPNIYPNP